MADLEKTVEVIFAGKDRLSDTMKKMTKGLAKFDAAVQSIAAPLAGAADAVIKVDAALSAMVIGGLALSIRESGKFGDSFAEISTLIDDTGAGVGEFRKEILAYARDSGMAIEDINKAVYSALSNGIAYQEALENLNKAEKLSVAGKGELADTLKFLCGTLSAYGESTDQAGKYSDILFMTIKKGETTLSQLSSSLSQVTGIAANAGIPIETLAAAVAALTAANLPTSQAITQLKAAITNMIKPSSQAAEEIERLAKEGKHLDFSAAAIQSKGFENVLWDVYKATGGNVEKMGKFFGSVEGLNAALVLGADKAGKFEDALQAMANATGATEKAYKKMVDNFGLINQNLANNVRVTLIEVGDKIIKRYAGIAGEVSEVFKGIGTAIDAGTFDPLFKALDEFGKGVQGFFDALGKSLPEALAKVKWDRFLDALGDLGDSIGNLFGDFDPADPQKVADAIQFVVDSIESLIRVTKGMVDSFKPFIEAILESVGAFNKMDTADKEAAGNILGLAKALVTLGSGLTTLLLLIGDNAEEIERTFNIIAGSLKIGWGVFKTGIQTIAIAILSHIDRILGAMSYIPDPFGLWTDKLEEARNGIAKALVGIIERVQVSAAQVGEGWDQLVGNIGDKPVKGEVDVNTSAFESNLAKVNRKMADWEYEEAMKKLTIDNRKALNAISEAENKLEDFASQFVDSVRETPIETSFIYNGSSSSKRRLLMI